MLLTVTPFNIGINKNQKHVLILGVKQTLSTPPRWEQKSARCQETHISSKTQPCQNASETTANIQACTETAQL